MARPSLLRVAGGRRRRVAAGLALLVAAAVVVTLVLRSGSSPSSGASRGAAKPRGAATVRRRNLVATDTESGTLSYANPQTVYNRLSGTITWLPQVGRKIKPGGVLYRVDGQPVILMNGSTPAYRTLSAADVDGRDVLELNRNLKRLGFNAAAITADDVWQAATSLGVELLQESLGEDPTGSLSLGQIVFLPGPQLVSSLDATVGSTGGGSGGSSAASSDSGQDSALADPQAAAEFVSLTTTSRTAPRTTPTSSTTPTTTTTTTKTTPTGTTIRATPTAPTAPGAPTRGSPPAEAKTLSALAGALRAEGAQLRAATAALKAATKRSHHSSRPSSSTGGDTPTSAQAILETTSTRMVVTVDLSASSQSEAKVGEHVTVELPAGNVVRGRITAVSSVAQSSSSAGAGASGLGGGSEDDSGDSGASGSSSTVPVTIALRGAHAGASLDQASVSVDFVEHRAKHVLSVPITALVATSGATYALQQARAPHRLVRVTPGLFAAGYVQVSGRGVHPGLAVTDSQG